MSDAETLGWGDRWRAHLEVAAMETGEDLAAGRVIAVHRGTVEVAILSGARDSAAHGFRTVDLGARGHSTGDEVWPPVVGDWVGLRHVETPAPVIAAVLPRRTYLGRPSPSGRSVGQPIAANIDVVLIVEPMDPTPSVGRVERFAAMSRSAGAEAWLVLTKTDLVAPEVVEEALTGMAPWVDAAVGVTSADPASTERLRTLLPKGATAVLVGRSGAGKSTLLNTILGVDHATGEVRSSDSKGRHTTTRRELLARRGISLIDTPGVRALAATVDGEAIDDVFSDIIDAAAACRYANCQHGSEPGCAVREAITEGRLDPERLGRYQRMLRESARLAARSDARHAREQERRAFRNDSRGRRGVMRLKGR